MGEWVQGTWSRVEREVCGNGEDGKGQGAWGLCVGLG